MDYDTILLEAEEITQHVLGVLTETGGRPVQHGGLGREAGRKAVAGHRSDFAVLQDLAEAAVVQVGVCVQIARPLHDRSGDSGRDQTALQVRRVLLEAPSDEHLVDRVPHRQARLEGIQGGINKAVERRQLE